MAMYCFCLRPNIDEDDSVNDGSGGAQLRALGPCFSFSRPYPRDESQCAVALSVRYKSLNGRVDFGFPGSEKLVDS